ncbi:1553_t:CDS:1 [Cetraspora pellucida]|uniref:1553_t:CDS:1 n=1 Tax=Cetraspora pellucida TaxID=1433469 RepID=A0A9N9GK87_9GLOM|nr:1553_t:CDS:1 [Cetraspora pellucida]
MLQTFNLTIFKISKRWFQHGIKFYKLSSLTQTSNIKTDNLIFERFIKTRKVIAWNEEEIKRLHDAVAKHGPSWKTIWEKYFKPHRTPRLLNQKWRVLNMIKQRPSYYNPWTPEEDEILKSGVAKYGVGKWIEISKLFKQRDSLQIRSRWKVISSKTRGKWTPEEDSRLLELIKIHGNKWTMIGKTFNRSPDDVYLHYFYLNRVKWTKEEDEKLHDLIKKYGEDWNIIKKDFPKRSFYDIKLRYIKYPRTNPNINVGKWKSEEITAFYKAFVEFGKKWKYVADSIGTRTPNQCSQYYYRKHCSKKKIDIK